MTTPDKQKRNLVCWLIGHDPTTVAPGVDVCDRCGDTVSYYHDGTQWTDRELYGVIDPLRWYWWRLRHDFLPSVCRKCDQCGKRMWLGSRYSSEFCSKKCHDEWIPFW